jgi:Winged helix DNA-binding domain
VKSAKAMPKLPSQTIEQAIARFRLRRHHLLEETPADAVTICRDVCGVQAQVMSAAYLQLWARNHALTRAEIEHALWQTRALVKTSLMRQTLHLIPSDEFQLYISALRPCRVADALRVMARLGIAREEGEAVAEMVMEALASGPLGRQAIAAALRPKASKRVRAWMELSWSLVRLPVADGLVCYGRGESNEVTFIRVDQWLPKAKRKPISPAHAQAALLQKYLRAYGPATLVDFAHWSGIPMREVRPLRARLDSTLAELEVDKKNCLILREDANVLNETPPHQICIRLLPLFDTYLLAHRHKDHLLAAEQYKRVYRNQGWISSVVLIDGGIAGVWSYELQRRKLILSIEPFGKISKVERSGMEREAALLASFFDRELELAIA